MARLVKKEDNVAAISKHMVEVRNLFVQLFNQMVQADEDIAAMPFSVSQLKTLSAFHEDREYTMSELSRNALVKMPSMTEMVDRLEAEGILARVRDPNDRRVVNVRLTAAGKKIHREFVSKRKNKLHKMFNKLSLKDKTELVQALKRVSAILHKIAE